MKPDTERFIATTDAGLVGTAQNGCRFVAPPVALIMAKRQYHLRNSVCMFSAPSDEQYLRAWDSRVKENMV